jgi:hypothetical protein
MDSHSPASGDRAHSHGLISRSRIVDSRNYERLARNSSAEDSPVAVNYFENNLTKKFIAVNLFILPMKQMTNTSSYCYYYSQLVQILLGYRTVS